MAGIVAFAVAVEIAVEAPAGVRGRASAALRDDLVARVRAAVPDAVLNGDPVDRLPGNAHFSFPGCEGDALLLLLDAAGHRLLDRLGLLGRGGPAVARAARDGRRRRPRARSSLRFTPRPHLDRGRRRRAGRRRSARRVERARRAGARAVA